MEGRPGASYYGELSIRFTYGNRPVARLVKKFLMKQYKNEP
jgi:hypothetical protein